MKSIDKSALDDSHSQYGSHEHLHSPLGSPGLSTPQTTLTATLDNLDNVPLFRIKDFKRLTDWLGDDHRDASAIVRK